MIYWRKFYDFISVAEPNLFYAAPAPGKNSYAAKAAPALASTLLYSKLTL
jgi:hypothetical protein